MATVDLQGTKFSFSILPIKNGEEAGLVQAEIIVENEFVHYKGMENTLTRDELEEYIFSMRRLLAGAYATNYALSFPDSGLAMDFYPYTENDREVPREKRRQEDCVTVIRFLMRASKSGKKLGGVYSLLLHREDIEKFSQALLDEYRSVYDPFEATDGEFLFVAVSPLGYSGCHYWYLDPTKSVKRGDFVWVRMGRRNIEQVVYVDHARYCGYEDAPYSPDVVKQVLRKAERQK